jgi:hypothetical protein
VLPKFVHRSKTSKFKKSEHRYMVADIYGATTYLEKGSYVCKLPSARFLDLFLWHVLACLSGGIRISRLNDVILAQD